jgi:hypothetical protein
VVVTVLYIKLISEIPDALGYSNNYGKNTSKILNKSNIGLQV